VIFASVYGWAISSNPAIVAKAGVSTTIHHPAEGSKVSIGRDTFRAWQSEPIRMKRLISFSLAVFTCLCLLIATERQALAYVDPGSGMVALQSLASILAAAGYFMRRRIAALFGRKKPEETAEVPVTVQKESSRNAA
jgi:hypothetical protein